jgi:predicted glycosyltransferase
VGKLTRTVVFQPPNRIGLGHVARLSAIALSMRELDPSLQTLFVMESASEVFLEAAALPYVSVPTRNMMIRSMDAWESWTADSCKQLIRGVCNTVLDIFSPALTVFDCLPNIDVTMECIRRNIPMALCLREMIDLKSYLKMLAPVIPRFEFIIVPHEPGTFTVPDALAKRTHFVGQITRRLPPFAVTEAADPLIVISGGGGGYQGTVQFYNLALRAFSIVRRTVPRVQGLLVPGPLFREWDELELTDGIRVHPFDPGLLDQFAKASVVVCQAGYNTIAELSNLGTPAISIPALRMFDDQRARAEGASGLYPNIVSCPTDDHLVLSRAMEQMLSEKHVRSQIQTPTGAVAAARVIIDFVDKQAVHFHSAPKLRDRHAV